MDIPVYNPEILVTLYKTISREKTGDGAPVSARFKGTKRTIDLTPYLSETSGVRTSKSVREPAGAFSLTLADKPNEGALGFETLYGLIEPMDFIEIRMRHGNVPGSRSGKPPIIMRGFVSIIQRTETMDTSGKPIRAVIISGQDYGKLWQMLQILFLPGYVVGQDVLSNFKLFERFGVGFQTTMTAGDFVKQMVEKIINPYLKTLMPENSPHPKEIKLDISVKHGTTSITGPQNQEGSIYDLLKTYGDVGIWNELFIEDREDGVYCVYRPNPYKSVDGRRIHDDSPDIPIIPVDHAELTGINVSRSDANVANFYWVRAPRFELATDVHRKQFGIINDKDTMLLDEYENTQSKLYGTRVMYGDTQQGGDDIKSFNSGQDKDTQKTRDTSQSNWINDRRRLMVEQNKDNVVLEGGGMRIAGREDIRAGYFIALTRGTFTAEYYAPQVSHEFLPFQNVFTTLTVERGMGFIGRAQLEGGSASPYLAEMTNLTL